MRSRAYLARLQRDVDRWISKGLIEQSVGKTLYADAEANAADVEGSSPILPGLAALVIMLGLLLIIAANWSELIGVMRLALYALLFGGLCISSAGLRIRDAHLPAGLVGAIATALVGGGLVVVGQLYHTSATTSAFLSVWSLLGLAVAFLLRSVLGVAIALGLTAAWTIAHIGESGSFGAGDGIRLYGPLWALPTLFFGGVIAWLRRALGLVHVGFIAAAIWIMPTLFDLADSIFTDDTLRLLFFAVVWASAAAAFEIVARGQALWASRTLAGWCAWIAGAFLTAAAVQRRATDSFLGGFDLAILALVAFAALAAYGAAPGRRWLRGAGVAGFLATSIIFFTVADDLLVSGIVMTGFGIALTALIFVTNRMLKRARAAGVAS